MVTGKQLALFLGPLLGAVVMVLMRYAGWPMEAAMAAGLTLSLIHI